MTQGIDGARELIELRLREIDEEAGGLRRALVSLGDGAAKARQRERPNAGDAKAADVHRAANAKQFLAAIKSKPGSTPAELGKAIGISTNQAYALGQRLLKAGQVRKSGKGFRVAKKP